MSKPRYTVDNLEAGESIGFLIKRCGTLMTQIAERRFESTTNVSFTQWTTLMTLSKSAEPISATQLSNYCGHDMGALTRVVDELERRGLVRRERSRRDRRAVEIVITAAGRRQAESAKRVIVELLNELLEPYSEAEVATLIDLMQRMLVRLDSAATSAAGTAPVPQSHDSRRKSKSGGLA
jgi:DNA-binding MarR family transcriptional regulator